MLKWVDKYEISVYLGVHLTERQDSCHVHMRGWRQYPCTWKSTIVFYGMHIFAQVKHVWIARKLIRVVGQGSFFIMWIHPILSVVLISVHGHWIKDLQNTRSSSFHSMETVIHSYFWFQIRGDINRFKPVCCHCMQQLGTWNVSDCKCTASFRPALYL